MVRQKTKRVFVAGEHVLRASIFKKSIKVTNKYWKSQPIIAAAVIKYQSQEIKSLTKSWPYNTHRQTHTSIYILSAAICCKWWAINSVALSLTAQLTRMDVFTEYMRVRYSNKLDALVERHGEKSDGEMGDILYKNRKCMLCRLLSNVNYSVCIFI